MSYLVDLNNTEIIDLLKNGSTNQKDFVQDILNSGNHPEEVIEQIKQSDDAICSKTELRGWINGGVLKFEPITEDIEEHNYYILCDNGYGVVYY